MERRKKRYRERDIKKEIYRKRYRERDIEKEIYKRDIQKRYRKEI